MANTLLGLKQKIVELEREEQREVSVITPMRILTEAAYEKPFQQIPRSWAERESHTPPEQARRDGNDVSGQDALQVRVGRHSHVC